MDAVERASLARDKLEAVYKEIDALLRYHENNRFLNYSRRIVEQVGHSFAANAFEALQEACLYAEFSCICRLWDTPKDLRSNEHSIPAIVKLLDDREVFTSLFPRPRDWHRKGWLAFAINHQKRVSSSIRLTSVRNFRDKFIAHSLARTRAEAKGQIRPAKYGDEEWLLGRTIVVFEKLWKGINIGTLDVRDDITRNRKCAEFLWDRAEMNIGG